MMPYTFLLLVAILLASCGDDPRYAATTPANDSTTVAIDTLVSDVSWDDDLDEENYQANQEESSSRSYNSSSSSSRRSSSSSSSSSSNGRAAGGAADNDLDVVKYQNYERIGTSPKDFATALIYPAIRMVYSDNFAKPKVKVSNATQEGDRHTMDVSITWKDHWVSKYRIDGTLMVNADGSDVNFVITDKNVEAEVLELTEDSFQSTLTLPAL
ncbi:MAG: hypothetical protein ACRBFS_01455 [Aureispira sp.]